MEVLAALGLGAKELFSYNRENFKFDQDQRIERETLRYEMQVKRFELFREDVRDLVELTVDRMDVYHLVGALFLEFCVVLFCEGRVQGSAPPFLLSMFLLSNACAFIYLLLAVWLSMHASIASHSCGVKLLTRFVRLPIPTNRQMNMLRSQLKDYERQSISNLLKLPFLDKREHDWDTSLHIKRGPSDLGASAAAAQAPKRSPKLGPQDPTPSERGSRISSLPLLQLPRQVVGSSPSPELRDTSIASANGTAQTPAAALLGRSAVESCEPSGMASGQTGFSVLGVNANDEGEMLPADDGGNIGGQELLEARMGAKPERHIQLFRQLQSKWQCYDAYCRVCMGLGVNQILQALSYYAICHTLVENHSPSTGYALIVLFQSTTVALAVLDLAGMRRREILAVQIVGIMPCAVTALGVAAGARDNQGKLDPNESYRLSPLSFLFQALWLELWLRVAAPSDDQARLPRRFRQVLFLDVFGDALDWDPSQAEAEDDEHFGSGIRALKTSVNELNEANQDDGEVEDDAKALEVLAERAASQLTLAQCALRRWKSIPDWTLNAEQKGDLSILMDRWISWGSTVNVELQRFNDQDAAKIFEVNLRPWHDLSDSEKSADPFAKCLLGPFDHDAGYQRTLYHYDVEGQRSLFEETLSKECPGALLLTLDAVKSVIMDLEKDARLLMETRIMVDLRAETRRRKSLARAKAKGLQSRLQEKAAAKRASAAQEATSRLGRAAASFPNLVGLFRKRMRPVPSDEHFHLIPASEGCSHTLPVRASASSAGDLHEMSAGGASSSADPARATEPPTRPVDPTLVAMAGEHAKFFVPERLPWQVLSRMTRVLQLCWLFSALMAFLKETRILQIDFQEHPAGAGRRLCAARQSLLFTEISVRWPHGELFRPLGLACPSVSARFESGSKWLVFSSPFGLYGAWTVDSMSSPLRSGRPAWSGQMLIPSFQDDSIKLEELHRLRVPSVATVLCAPVEISYESNASTKGHSDSLRQLETCLIAAVTERGVEVWAATASREQASVLSQDGANWKLLTGAVVQCAQVSHLLPPDDTVDSAGVPWCLALVGWDGELLPVAAMTLPEGLGRPPKPSLLRPAFDAPLLSSASDSERVWQSVLALHSEPVRGRLSALLAWKTKFGGRSVVELQVWDIVRARVLGRQRLEWPLLADQSFLPSAFCTDTTNDVMLIVGRSEIAGPLLLRASGLDLDLEVVSLVA